MSLFFQDRGDDKKRMVSVGVGVLGSDKGQLHTRERERVCTCEMEPWIVSRERERERERVCERDSGGHTRVRQ